MTIKQWLFSIFSEKVEDRGSKEMDSEARLSGPFLEELYEKRKRLFRETPKNHPNHECNLVAVDISANLRLAARKDVLLPVEAQQMIEAASYRIAQETLNDITRMEKLGRLFVVSYPAFKWSDLLVLATYINSFERARESTAE